MTALENIQRLLFQNDLLMAREILGKFGGGFIRYRDEFFGYRLRHQSCAGGATDAVRRKLREFRIVDLMDAAVRNQKDAPFARRVREAMNFRQKLLGPGHVKFAARLHEIFLRVHRPEDYVVRDRLIFHHLDFSTRAIAAREPAGKWDVGNPHARCRLSLSAN